MSVHIFTTRDQPYTKWRLGRDIIDPPTRWFRCSPRKQAWCHICMRKRWAKNLKVRAYYDQTIVSCAEPDAHTVERVPYSVWSKR